MSPLTLAFGLIVALLAGTAQAHSKSGLAVPKYVEPGVNFPVVFQMFDKNTRYYLSSLNITFPDGTIQTIPAASLYFSTISEQGNWTIYTAVIPAIYTGLKIGFKLTFDVSRCNSPSEAGAFCAIGVANRIYGGLPTLTIQPFHCAGHEYHVNDIVHLYIHNWELYYSPAWTFSNISIYAEHGKCNSVLITTLPAFASNTQKPYHVIDWIVPAKYKHSIVRLVLKYTVTTNFGPSVPAGTFEERSIIPIHVE